MAAHVPQRQGVVRLSLPGATRWLAAPAWLLLLAALPWWLGLPALLACVLTWLLWPDRRDLLRRGLRWGLAGLLLAILRAGGGDALAWLLTLLAALVGFSLLMLLEGWRRPAPTVATAAAAWPELALAPIGPAATIIELRAPQWRDLAAGLADPLGGELGYGDEAVRLADGQRLYGTEPCCDYAPDGRWLILPMAQRRGLVLLDRRRGRRHRLRGWQLCGWHAGEPWLIRGETRAPQPASQLLG